MVFFGWLGFIPGMVNVSTLRTILMLGSLKNVKTIPALGKMLRSLLRSLPDHENIVSFLGFFIFGTIGLAFLYGVCISDAVILRSPMAAHGKLIQTINREIRLTTLIDMKIRTLYIRKGVMII